MKTINQKEFDEVTKTGICLVDFYATWCMPCRMFGAILEDIEEEIGESVKIFKVDVDENEALSRKFGVLSIPTILILKDGVLQEKHVGVWSKEDCIEAIKKYQ
ncbi:MAG: thioredoxin [Clostridia bacterium]|nr:thioredoxin [Clostridia bacterium]